MLKTSSKNKPDSHDGHSLSYKWASSTELIIFRAKFVAVDMQKVNNKRHLDAFAHPLTQFQKPCHNSWFDDE